MTTTIEHLQATWSDLTGQTLHPLATQRLFFEYQAMGFTETDLACVLNHLLRFNRKHSGGPRFRINAVKILGDLEYFASLLGEAQAVQRNRKPVMTPKEQVLQQFQPVVVETQGTGTARTIQDVMKAMQ